MSRNKPVDKEWLAELKVKIKEAGGQKRVAELAGVNQSSVSKFLNGRDVKVSTARALLPVLGLSVDDMPDIYADELSDRYRALALEQELTEAIRSRTEMRVKVLLAVDMACRVAGVSEEQKEIILAAALEYETCQDESGVREAAARYAVRDGGDDKALGA